MSNKIHPIIKNRAGFTLVEVMVALTIIMVGIIGAYALVNQSLALANNASMRLTASYLGKEGIEIVRNIRDSNYLNIYHNDAGSWEDGLLGCAGGCGADYTMLALDPSYANLPLRFDGDFFNYAAGEVAAYKRIITVVPFADHLEVGVEIKWNIGGRANSMVVREDIYNWWQ